MSRVSRGRWALSFADLCLLLLAFFVLLQASTATRDQALAGLNSYFGALHAPLQADLAADRLFQPGEALLSGDGRADLIRAVRPFVAGKDMIRIQSFGLAPGERRFDAWDLSAARLGAVARALVAAGIAPERISIAGLAEQESAPKSAENGAKSGQTIRLVETPRPSD